MRLIQIDPPEALPVSVEDFRRWRKLESEDDDDTMEECIQAATAWLDGYSGKLGRCLITQRWRWSLDFFPRAMIVPLPPCQAIDAITYLDIAGDEQTVDPADYTVHGLGSPQGARILPVSKWPTPWEYPGAVTVEFTAGYGDDGEAIPAPILHAVRLLAAHMYEQREPILTGTIQGELPYGILDLIGAYRVLD